MLEQHVWSGTTFRFGINITFESFQVGRFEKTFLKCGIIVSLCHFSILSKAKAGMLAECEKTFSDC